MVYQRYADADLITAEPSISLESVYGEPTARWPWYLGGGLLVVAALVVIVLLAKRTRHGPAA